jgi:chromosomal replication initiation ATPase DnaA
MTAGNAWNQILDRLRLELDPEDFRRWFASSCYASDSGDLITVWVGTESERRHLLLHYLDRLDRELAALGRRNTQIRFIVAGHDEEDEEGSSSRVDPIS